MEEIIVTYKTHENSAKADDPARTVLKIQRESSVRTNRGSGKFRKPATQESYIRDDGRHPNNNESRRSRSPENLGQRVSSVRNRSNDSTKPFVVIKSFSRDSLLSIETRLGSPEAIRLPYYGRVTGTHLPVERAGKTRGRQVRYVAAAQYHRE